jgi:hypothetical protein
MSTSPQITSFKFPDMEAVNVLREDLLAYEQDLDLNMHDQRLRRAYVRAAMALVESVIHSTKDLTYNFATQVILPLQQHLGARLHRCPVSAITQKLTHGELSLLRDEQLTVKNSGEVDSSTSFVDFKKSVKFTFKMASRVFATPLALDFSGDPGWHSLTQAGDIRNRLVHPKPGESMNVTDGEIDNVRNGYCWTLSKGKDLALAIQPSWVRVLADLAQWVSESKSEFVSELGAEIEALTDPDSVVSRLIDQLKSAKAQMPNL